MQLGIGLGLGLSLFRNVVSVIVNLLYSLTVTRASTRTVMGYASGATLADGQSLLTVPANVPAIKGARLVGSTWYTTDINGVALPVEGVSIGIAGENSSTADDIATIPTPSILTPEQGAIEIVLTPDETAPAFAIAVGSTIDASNYLYIYQAAGNIFIRRFLGGLSELVSQEYSAVNGTEARIQVYWDSVIGFGIRAADSSFDITTLVFQLNANTTAFPLNTTLTIGSRNGGGIFKATVGPQIKFYKSAEAAGWV